LLADRNRYGGANQCLIWTAFAKRGLGFSAVQGLSTDKTDNTQAFDVPPVCNLLEDNTPKTQTICTGQTATYSVWAGGNFTAPVTMSATGLPAGTTATFSPNPLATTKRLSFMTVGNTSGATGGTYFVNMVGAGGVSSNKQVTLTLVAPPIANSLAPANGTIGVALGPTLNWSTAVGAASYTVQIATDPGFSNIVRSATVAGTNYTVSPLLDPATA
jgi:hypothetical protein